MGLIDLYVAEVGKRLPLKGRGDIEAELRSTLEDMLEDRGRKAGRPADESMTLDMLREYGPPDKVAATYNTHLYLIGPRMFPFFVKVLKIVLSVLITVLLVLLGIRLSTQAMAGPELAQAIGEGLLEILNAAMLAFGNVVLVFAILERVAPTSEFQMDEERDTWDPASLRAAVEPDTIKPWEPIVTILFTLAALVLFNFYPEVIGLHYPQDGVWTSTPVLTDAFFRWMPLINLLWLLQIALNVVLFRQGRWKPATRWASMALDAAGLVMAYLLLVGPPIVAISPEALVSMGMTDAATAATLSTLFEQMAYVVLVIIIIVESVELVKGVIHEVRRRR